MRVQVSAHLLRYERSAAQRLLAGWASGYGLQGQALAQAER